VESYQYPTGFDGKYITPDCCFKWMIETGLDDPVSIRNTNYVQWSSECEPERILNLPGRPCKRGLTEGS